MQGTTKESSWLSLVINVSKLWCVKLRSVEDTGTFRDLAVVSETCAVVMLLENEIKLSAVAKYSELE